MGRDDRMLIVRLFFFARMVSFGGFAVSLAAGLTQKWRS
jgi:hypothetical protein